MARALGLEIAGTRLVAVEADPGTAPPTVRRAAATEIPAAGFGEPLRRVLAERRIGTRAAHVVLSDPGAVNRLLQLPPMTPAERRLYLEREIGRELGGKLLLGDVFVRQVDGAPPKHEVLAAAAPGEEGTLALAGVMAARLTPQLVTTGALALARAAEILAPEAFDRPAAVTHWGLRGLTITVVHDGTLKFSREVPHLGVPGLDAREWFVTEFQRSVRQYIQAKGEPIATVLIGSVDRAFEGTLGDVGARLGLPVVNLNETLQPLLPEAEDGAADVPAGVFLLAFGGAALPVKGSANLLPPAVVARRQTALLARGAVAAAVLGAAWLGYASWDAGREVATYRKALVRAAAEKERRLAEAAQMEQIKQERQKIYDRIRLLKGDPLGSPPLADVFKEISRVASSDLHLQQLTLKRDGLGTVIRLSGKVESTDLAQAQAEFNRFYVGLQGSPFFAEVTYIPPGLAKVAIQQGPSPVVEGRTARDFQIRAEMEREREAAIGSGREIVFELDLRLRGIE